jgi:O-antigen ligase
VSRPDNDRARHGWPVVAACAYAALIPLQPVFVLPDGSPLRFAAADAVAPLVFLAAIVQPARRLPFGPLALAMAIPVLAVLSTLWAAEDRPLSMYAVGKVGGLCYLVAISLALARTIPPSALPALVRALERGAFWSAVVGLFAYAAWLAGVPSELMSGDRLCSTMVGDPNIYGGLVALGLLIAATDGGSSPVTRAVHCSVLVLALIAAGSRSAMLGGAAAVVVYGIARSPDPFASAARAAYGIVALGLLAALALSTDVGSQAAAGIWTHHWREFTVDSRLDLYARAMNQFAEHPLGGSGIGGFHDLNEFVLSGHSEHYVVHNTYLWSLVDMGVSGGLLVVGLIAAAIVRCVRAARGALRLRCAPVVAGGLAGMAVFNLFIDGFYQRHFWVLLACAIAMPILRTVERAAPASAARAPVWGVP